MHMLKKIKVSLIIACFAFLSACTVTLAPNYDDELYRGITNLNLKVLTLFAAVPANGDSCDDQLDSYNEAIGLSGALAMQSRARPMPDNKIISKLAELLKSSKHKGAFDLTDEPPSVASLTLIEEQLTKMKREHCDTGSIGNISKQLYKNTIETSMDQAISYEAFLNRAGE
jgi:hypothetical protein